MFSQRSHRIPAASLVFCVCVLVSFRGCAEMPGDGNAGDSGAPIVDAGENQTVLENALVVLDGSSSSDPDGRDLSFQWSRVSGPLITFVGSRTSHPTFVAPSLGHDLTLEFKLEVGNGLATAEDATTIHVVQNEGDLPSRMCDDPDLPLHPFVEFIVEPVDGPGPLTIDCTAITSDGSELLSGSNVLYTWTVDGEGDSGPMETHANRSFVLSSSGAHTVTLCLTLSGLSWGCLDAQNPGLRERTVFVWPKISGSVQDGTQGIAGVAVGANNVPGGATDVTDSQGRYELSVPSGWSGVITPHHVDYDFQPASLEQVETTTSVSNQDFVASSSGSTVIGVYGPEDLAELLGSWGPCQGCPYDLNGDGEVNEEDLAILLANWGGDAPPTSDPVEHCTSNLDCDDGNFCNGPETCVDLACRPGVDPCPAQMCDEAGEACVDCLVDSDCDDGTFCNGAENCVSGLCEAGSNSCSGQLCDEDTDSCFDQACSSDADCDDNLFCNGTETCVNGLCASASAPCVGQQCDENSGSCADCLTDADCDDDLFCNGSETCQANLCVAGNDPCGSEETCDETNDACVPQSACADDSDCDDGLFCNGAETCQSGSCVSGTAPCSGQSCDEDSDSCGCSTDADCDDGLFCTGTESCNAGTCVTSGDPCEPGEACDEVTDTCLDGAAISGTISLVATVGARPAMGGISLSFTGSGGSGDYTAVTKADNTFEQIVPDGWTGTVAADDPTRVFVFTINGVSTETWVFGSGPGANAPPISPGQPPAPLALTVWSAPIGIPGPEFGIKETHYMYEGQLFDYDQDGIAEAPYKDAGNGPYTHYVDSSHPTCDDDSNLYGDESIPRCSLPRAFTASAGSVVEIHGGPYQLSSTPGSWTLWNANGSQDQPVFIRGADPENKPILDGPQVRLNGQYLIVENLALEASWIRFYEGVPSHMALRQLEIYDHPGIGSLVSVLDANDILVYNNHIHHNGDAQAPDEADFHGLGAGSAALRIWIMDNHIHHNAGDGVQINSPDDSLAQYVYLGRNLMHEDRENAVDIKGSRHVILSQNVMYGYQPVDSSDGVAIVGGHEGSQLSWFLFNDIYDSQHGIRVNDGEVNTEAYIIGNQIHDIIDTAIVTWWDNTVYAVNNVIHNSGVGFKGAGPNAAYHVVNNLISGMTGGGEHVSISHSGAATNSDMTHNLLHQAGGPIIIRWGSTYHYDIPSFQAATGKGEGCLEADPLFVDAANGDFRLQSASLAIDSGTVHEAYQRFFDLYGIAIDVDFDGSPRPQGAGWDIGLYEQ